MERRQALSVLGGGVILAAIAPMTGCSTDVPPEAIAAWKGSSVETDLRRWILAHAILAPHSHNLQSWLVDLREPGVITLHVDLTRLLPETDPLSRQIVMSQGTFLEVLSMAARERGYRADITPFPEGSFGATHLDKRPTARIRLVQDPEVKPDPLFTQVLKRHTNRSLYQMRRPEKVALEAIQSSMQGFPIASGFSADDSNDLNSHRQIAKDAWKVEMTTARTLLESYKVLRVGPEEIARYRDGLTINTPMVRALVALGLFDRTKPSAPDSSAVTGQIEQFNAKIDATPSFFWMRTEDNARATQLQAGRAYVRAQLAATAHGLSMHPLQQALQEYPEQFSNYQAIHRLLNAGTDGRTIQMWARLGYAPPVEPSPRRGIDSHIFEG